MDALIKDGVVLKGISPEIVLGRCMLAETFTRHGIPLVITSCRDGKHMDGSKHYVGDAIDIRLASRYSSLSNIDLLLLNEGREALGNQYDFVLEQDHYHLEFDPKDPHV